MIYQEPISHIFIAVILMAMGSALAPLVDVGSKILVATLPVIQVVWMRYLGHALFTGIMASCAGGGYKTLKPSLLQLLRGGVQFSSSLCFIASLATLHLTTALIIIFLAPLFVVIVRACFGFKDADRTNIILAASGTLGAFISYMPSTMTIAPMGVMFASIAAILFAVYFLLTGYIAKHSNSIVNSFHTAFPGAVVGSLFVLTSYVHPTRLDWAILTSLGLGSAVCHILIAAAMRSQVSSGVSTIAYLEIPIGAFYAFLIFGERPSLSEIIGGIIVIGVGLAVALRLKHH